MQRPAVAETPQASEEGQVFRFDIKAGAATDSLLEFADKSQLQLLYKPHETDGVTTNAVVGEFEAWEALRRLLAGTTLAFTRINSGAATIGLKSEPKANPPPHANVAPKRLRGPRGPTDRRTLGVNLEEVTVLGTMLSNQPTLIGQSLEVTREQIDATGSATVAGVIRTLPLVFGGGPTEDTHEVGDEARTNTGLGYGINVRALGAGSVLILINGHRLAGGGQEGAFVDVSSLPLAAVDRMIFLPEGSSAAFGSDAVGGTVNFVMRDKFKGAMTSGQYGTTTRNDLSESYVSQIFGGSGSWGSGLITFDYYTRGNLQAALRAQMTSNLTPFGGSDFDQPIGNPGTLIAGGTTWAIPEGQDGTHLSSSSFTPGTMNKSDRWAFADALPLQQRWSTFGTWNKPLTDSISIFADILYSQRYVEGRGAPAAGNVIVPPSNAFYVNPIPGTPVSVAYSFAKELGPVIGTAGVKTHNVAAGVNWTVDDIWTVIGTATRAGERLRTDFRNMLDRDAMLSALVDSNRATALNVFGDGNHTNPATVDRLRTSSDFGSDSYVTSANVRALGDVLDLPGGSLRLSLGAEYRKQSFSTEMHVTARSPLLASASSRTIRAMFVHASAPLWGKPNRMKGLEKLELTLAGRYEQYSDFGSSFTPSYGLVWSPLRSLSFRASWSRSFRAPTLADLDESGNAMLITFLPDLPAGSRSATLVWTGKSADVREETARSHTVGLDFKPESVAGLSLATTYFDVDFTNRLVLPGLSADALINPRYADLVTRNPTAEQIDHVCGRSPLEEFVGTCRGTPVSAIIDARLRNDAEMRTRGFDVSAEYKHATSVGQLSLGVSGTYIIDFADRTSHDQSLHDRVSTQNHPIDLRWRASAGWKRGGFEAHGFVNFMNHYRDEASIPARTVESLLTFDASAQYTLPRSAWGLGETTLAFAAQNLFDRDPPFLNNAVGVGYDQENGDIVGRFVSFTIRQTW